MEQALVRPPRPRLLRSSQDTDSGLPYMCDVSVDQMKEWLTRCLADGACFPVRPPAHVSHTHAAGKVNVADRPTTIRRRSSRKLSKQTVAAR